MYDMPCISTADTSFRPYDQQQDVDRAGHTAAPRHLPGDLVLGGIRVVLVAPKTEANIGAVARACGNFEVQCIACEERRRGGICVSAS